MSSFTTSGAGETTCLVCGRPIYDHDPHQRLQCPPRDPSPGEKAAAATAEAIRELAAEIRAFRLALAAGVPR